MQHQRLGITIKAIFQGMGIMKEIQLPSKISGQERNGSGHFKNLIHEIISRFPSLGNADFDLTWKDSEGDIMMISSDEDLFHALTSSGEEKLTIYIGGTAVSNVTSQSSARAPCVCADKCSENSVYDTFPGRLFEAPAIQSELDRHLCSWTPNLKHQVPRCHRRWAKRYIRRWRRETPIVQSALDVKLNEKVPHVYALWLAAQLVRWHLVWSGRRPERIDEKIANAVPWSFRQWCLWFMKKWYTVTVPEGTEGGRIRGLGGNQPVFTPASEETLPKHVHETSPCTPEENDVPREYRKKTKLFIEQWHQYHMSYDRDSRSCHVDDGKTVNSRYSPLPIEYQRWLHFLLLRLPREADAEDQRLPHYSPYSDAVSEEYRKWVKSYVQHRFENAATSKQSCTEHMHSEHGNTGPGETKQQNTDDMLTSQLQECRSQLECLDLKNRKVQRVYCGDYDLEGERVPPKIASEMNDLNTLNRCEETEEFDNTEIVVEASEADQNGKAASNIASDIGKEIEKRENNVAEIQRINVRRISRTYTM